MGEAVAIVGMACRFPGAGDLSAYWRLLTAGEDAVGAVPAERWNSTAFFDPDPAAPGKMVSREGGFLEDLDRFDADFFGISPREAHQVDPRQRLVLEAAWHALEDAGVRPSNLAGSDTGVFVAHLTGEYEYEVMARRLDLIDPYSGAGTTDSVLSNRLSYSLDLRGPSLSVDTACSGSLVAVHLACRALSAEDCSLALVGGVNVVLEPCGSIFFSKAGALSPDGRCRPFDHRANGIVRGEGVGMLVLKPLSRAEADGDRVYATLLGSATNHNGHGNGLMAPNAASQVELLRRAYREAGIDPAAVSYVEAHGTGTRLGDPVEASAMAEVLGEGRPEDRPCAIGSVKSNLGHLEAAAGVAGLIKVALSLHHGQLPPSIHFEALNPLMSEASRVLAVQDRLRPWFAGGERRLAGVSSFGLGGANAHVVLAEAPPPSRDRAGEEAGAYLLPVSARSPTALGELAASFALSLDELTDDGSADALASICAAATHRRDHHRHRLAVTGRSAGELAAALRSHLEEPGEEGEVGTRAGSRAPRIALVFSGQGSQWPGMGMALARRYPVFAATLEAVDDHLRRAGGRGVLADLESADPDALATTDSMQPAIFAVQAALADLWFHLGVEPHVVAGQSLGEVAAAYAAGCLDLAAACRVVHHRSRLMQKAAGDGGTAFVAQSGNTVARRLGGNGGLEGVEVAGHLGPESCIVSGPAGAVRRCLAELEGQGIFCRWLDNGGVAFHGSAMEPLQEELEDAVAGLEPSAGRLPLATALAGGAVAGETLDAAYWGRNLRQPFRLDRLAEHLAGAGVGCLLEVAPHPVLRRALEGAMAAAGRRVPVLASLVREAVDERPLLDTLARLYEVGLGPLGVDDVEGWAELPLYPFQRRRYWYDLLPGAEAEPPSDHTGHPLLGVPLAVAGGGVEAVWQRHLGPHGAHWLRDHRLGAELLVPAAAYLEMALAAAGEIPGPEGGAPGVALEDVELHRMLTLEKDSSHTVQVVLDRDVGAGRRFRIASLPTGDGGRWVEHAVGAVRPVGEEDVPPRFDRAAVETRCRRRLDAEEHYARMSAMGLEYGPAFRVLVEARAGEGECLAHLRLPSGLSGDLYHLHPVMLDGALQAVAPALSAAGEEAWLPVGVGRARLFEVADAGLDELWCHVRMRETEEAAGPNSAPISADLTLHAADGAAVAHLGGVRFSRLDAGRDATDPPPRKLFHEIRWFDVPAPPADGPDTGGRWLLLGETPPAAALGRALEARGGEVVRVDQPPGSELDPGFWRRTAAGAPLRAVVDLRVLALDDDGADRLKAFRPRRVCLAGLALHHGRREGDATPAPVWVVTRGAQALSDAETPGLAGAVAWGFHRAVGQQEKPDEWGGLIDLDPALPADEATEMDALADLLVVATADGRREDLLARREEGWRAPRLVPVTPPRDPVPPSLLRADATYLVSGGFAALATPVVDWLESRGARRLLLAGRSPLPPRHRWASLPADHPAADRVARVRELEARGLSVQIASVDLADAEAVAALVRQYRAEGRPPVRGLVHLAGVVRDHLLGGLGEGDVDAVLGSKLDGAVHLVRALGEDLEEVVLFSSLAAWISPAGQSLYAAANAGLDALAVGLRRRGVDAVSLGWGPWRSGMVERLGLADRLRAGGMTPLSDEAGLQTLEAMGRPGAGSPHRLVLSADWRRITEGHYPGPAPPLLDEVRERREKSPRQQAAVPPGEATAGWADITDPEERRGALVGLLASQVAEVLRLGDRPLDPVRPLAELGMDSIVAMELKTAVDGKLNVSVPIADWLAGPSLESLAASLDERLAQSGWGSTQPADFSVSSGASASFEIQTERR